MPLWYNNKVKLLLTSAGIKESFKDIFFSLLTKELKDVSVLHIVTAAYGEEGPYWWIEQTKDELKDLGIARVEDFDIRWKTKEQLIDASKDRDIILVNGGNTFYLLDYVRKTGFDDIIKEHVGKGKLYIGVSAGSILATPTIESAKWEPADMNNIELADLTGLNLVSFLIHPHFIENQREQLEKLAKTNPLPTIALNDNQAVLVDGEIIKVVGDSEKIFFNGFKEIL